MERDNMTSSSKVTFNLTGTIFDVSAETYGRLKGLSEQSQLLIEEAQKKDFKSEVFLEQDPACFAALLFYCRQGELHLPTGICPQMFKAEMQRWGVELSQLSNCCFQTMVAFLDDRSVVDSFEQGFSHTHRESADTYQVSVCQSVRLRVWNVLDRPSSSFLAKAYFAVLLAFLVLSLLSMVASTHPAFLRHMSMAEWQEALGDSYEQYMKYLMKRLGIDDPAIPPLFQKKPPTSKRRRRSLLGDNFLHVLHAPQALSEILQSPGRPSAEKAENPGGNSPQRGPSPHGMSSKKIENPGDPSSEKLETAGGSDRERMEIPVGITSKRIIIADRINSERMGSSKNPVYEVESLPIADPGSMVDIAGDPWTWHAEGKQNMQLDIKQPPASATAHENAAKRRKEKQAENTPRLLNVVAGRFKSRSQEMAALTSDRPQTYSKLFADMAVMNSDHGEFSARMIKPLDTDYKLDNSSRTSSVQNNIMVDTPKGLQTPIGFLSAKDIREEAAMDHCLHETQNRKRVGPIFRMKRQAPTPPAPIKSSSAPPQDDSTQWSDSGTTESQDISMGNATEDFPAFNKYRARLDFLQYVDQACLAFFTLEFLLRILTCPRLTSFLRNVLNIADFVALVAGYTMVLLEQLLPHEKYSVSSLDFIDCLQIFRLVRFFRPLRDVLGFRVLIHSVKASSYELLLLVLFLSSGVVVFGTLVYWCERDNMGSIPDAFWWAVITMTTVGYGDLTPSTFQGKLVGSLCALSGVILLAITVPVLVNNFLLFHNCAKVIKVRQNETKKKDVEVKWPNEAQDLLGRSAGCKVNRIHVQPTTSAANIGLQHLEDVLQRETTPEPPRSRPSP